MGKLVPLLFLFAAPFWEEKPPEQWTDAELLKLLTDSPWSQMASAPGNGAAPAVQVYLATAAPMEQAEKERERRYRLRHPRNGAEAGDILVDEYREWLQQNRGSQIVLAIGTGEAGAFSNDREIRQMEAECVMHVGKKKYKISGHFAPSAGDPYLRLAFPRAASASDKTITFDLYIPGVSIGSRFVEFNVKDMLVKGKLEM